jgi:hypothetical protein
VSLFCSFIWSICSVLPPESSARSAGLEARRREVSSSARSNLAKLEEPVKVRKARSDFTLGNTTGPDTYEIPQASSRRPRVAHRPLILPGVYLADRVVKPIAPKQAGRTERNAVLVPCRGYAYEPGRDGR